MPKPKSTFARMSALDAALESAPDYATWLQVAGEIDQATGAAAWQDQTSPTIYNARLLHSECTELARRREAGDALGLVDAVESSLRRHRGDLAAPELYTTALCGTQHAVTRWLDEVECSLRWLVDAEIPGLGHAAKLQRFERSAQVYGRSALVLSGGATWGFHHLGVVSALFENGLLPDVMSGASTGAMVAAGVCTRTDDELADMFANTEQIRLDGLKPIGIRAAARARAWLDPGQLEAVLRSNVGVYTFAEAHRRSGRVLNISVAPVRSRQKPLLLSHLTTPDVWVHSAAMASSSLPGLFPPAMLESRTRSGASMPFTPDERWIDGSLYADLPKQRLARLYNVNHFILSQTNPHALPFARLNGRNGFLPTMASVAMASARAQGGMALEVAQRVTRPGSSPLRQVTERGLALFGQSYTGDIDIHPRFRLDLLRKVAINPSRPDLATFIREGRHAVWPMLARIRDQTRIERTFQACLEQLEARMDPAH